MSKIAIVYWSGTGNTEAMADFVKAGAVRAGSEPDVFTPETFGSGLADQYEAIAFGCPAMGDEELEETEFLPMFEEVEEKLRGKKIALFGSYDWGTGEWMDNWKSQCEKVGAVFVCDCVIANNEPDDEAEAALKAMGEALARI